MEASDLVILERMNRNYPCKRLNMGRVDGEYGSIFLAWGKDTTGCYFGSWGYMGVARFLEAKPKAKLKMFKEILLRDAEGFISELVHHHMIKEGTFRAQ